MQIKLVNNLIKLNFCKLKHYKFTNGISNKLLYI